MPKFFVILAAVLALAVPAAAGEFSGLKTGDKFQYQRADKGFTVYTEYKGPGGVGHHFRSDIGRGGHSDEYYNGNFAFVKSDFVKYSPHVPAYPVFDLGKTWTMSFTEERLRGGYESNTMTAACVVQELDAEKQFRGGTFDAAKVVCNVSGDKNYTQTTWFDRSGLRLSDKKIGDDELDLEITKVDLAPRGIAQR